MNDEPQELGAVVPNWEPPPPPARTALQGRFCCVTPIDPEKHAAALFRWNSQDTMGRLWTYLPYGPFRDERAYLEWLRVIHDSDDPFFYAIVDLGKGEPTGVASYLRIDSGNGVIEVGHINFAPTMQRKPIGTEAMYLMMRNAFELGYRRYEWKCDALNLASRRAALRLGFRYEGTFRQARIAKGRNRDTAWYAIIDKDWPRLRTALEQWLAPSNFSETGQQRKRLSEITAAVVGTP